MKYGSLILEKKEYVYLKRILNISGYAENHETQKCLARLLEELRTAQIVDDDEMPYDIIRFNSKVTITFDNGIKETVQVVIPTDRDIKTKKISVLTPMGSALIGYSEDDIILWNFPNGIQKIHISKVEQEGSYKGIDITI